MQNSKIYQSPCLNSHTFSFNSINVLTHQKYTLATPCRPEITQDSQKKHPTIQTSFSSLPQRKSHDKTPLANGAHQVTHHISLIEDPLWKRVGADLVRTLGVKMMGSFPTIRLWNCRLDDLSGRDKIASIYCSTEHTTQFLEQYVFIVLGVAFISIFQLLKKSGLTMRLRLTLCTVMDEDSTVLTVVEEKYERSPFYGNGRSMRSLEESFQRAVFIMFIIGEVYPFLDGNRRICQGRAFKSK